jgi:glycosyltransferase involved in cell wall biosynthesis
MHVLMVSHRFPPDALAGVERYTQALAARLTAGGDSIGIVTRRPALESLHTLRERLPNGICVYRFVGGEARRERFLAYHTELDRLFEEVLQETAPDVVHINHILDLSPRFIEIAHQHGAAVVLTLHDFYFACANITLQKSSSALCQGPEGGRECARTCFEGDNSNAHGDAEHRWGLRTMYFRRLLAMAERVICPAQHVGDFFLQFGADADRLRVISNGTFIEAAGPSLDAPLTPRQRGRLRLAFLGAVAGHKGVHVILEALSIANLGDVDLVIMGPADNAEYARKLRERAAATAGVRLRFYGTYEPDELSFLLHDVDCVVVPSMWPEIFCLVAREALVRGIPIAVSRLGALPEAVEEGKNGFTFDPTQPQELAAILKRLTEEEDLVPQLRKGARGSAVMTMPQHAEAVRNVYCEAIEDMACGGAVRRGDTEEFSFLHGAALKAGFGLAN